MTDEPTAAAAQDNIVQLDADQKTVIDTSEIDLSMRFASLHENDIKYVGQWSRWLCYNGRSWDIDHSMKTYESAKQMLVKIAKRMYNAEMHARTGDIDKLGLSDRDKKNQHKTARKEALKIAKAVKGSKTVAAVVSLSRSDPKFITVGELWDSNPWLLNTPDGTINLKTGYVRDHNHRDFITMSTAVGPSARSPERWLEFMRTITDGDEMLQGYLQRVLGYCLSGQVGEHAMFFGFGTGANGKSVMLNTIGGLLGDYHKIMAMETLIITQEYRHPTELADLRGARMVTASETQKGRSWDEVKVKHLTGGDKVKARFMRQDFFEYKPQFKLFVAGNHKPAITSVDEAMRRRFNLIPFTVTIPAAQRDPYLADRLKAEWPQILNWMIEAAWSGNNMASSHPWL